MLLGASCYLLANTHAFSALLFITLGAYHLLFVAKDKRWLWVSMAVVLALLLFSPWAIVLVTKGIDRSFENWSPGQASLAEILWSWLVVNFNGAPVLAVLSATGLWIGIRDKTVAMRTHLLLPLFLAVLGLVAQITNSLSTNNMRLAMSAVPLVTLIFSRPVCTQSTANEGCWDCSPSFGSLPASTSNRTPNGDHISLDAPPISRCLRGRQFLGLLVSRDSGL